MAIPSRREVNEELIRLYGTPLSRRLAGLAALAQLLTLAATVVLGQWFQRNSYVEHPGGAFVVYGLFWACLILPPFAMLTGLFAVLWWGRPSWLWLPVVGLLLGIGSSVAYAFYFVKVEMH